MYNIEDRLTTEQAADVLKRTPHCLKKWRMQNKGPRCTAPAGGGKYLYRYGDILDWIESGEVRGGVTPQGEGETA